jgi:hypothetical protein
LSAIGLGFQIVYRLRRHLWLGWPLSRWLGFLLVVTILWQLIRWRSLSWQVIVLAVVYLVYVLVLAWTGRQGYVRFTVLSGTGPVADASNPLENEPSPPPPLGAQEMVPVRASGWFSVEGESQYYLDVEADFETVGTREHIVLGRVHSSRFLLFGQWPKYELGWWYIFFEPRMIQDVCLGHLHFGLRPRLALRVIYAPDAETRQTAYLTFDDTVTLRRVWDDLLLDAPEGAAA